MDLFHGVGLLEYLITDLIPRYESTGWLLSAFKCWTYQDIVNACALSPYGLVLKKRKSTPQGTGENAVSLKKDLRKIPDFKGPSSPFRKSRVYRKVLILHSRNACSAFAVVHGLLDPCFCRRLVRNCFLIILIVQSINVSMLHLP